MPDRGAGRMTERPLTLRSVGGRFKLPRQDSNLRPAD